MLNSLESISTGRTPGRLAIEAIPEVPLYQKKVTTEEGIQLTGFLSKGSQEKPVLLFLHGIGGDFSTHKFVTTIRERACKDHIGMLAVQTRRTGHESELKVPAVTYRIKENTKKDRILNPHEDDGWVIGGSRSATAEEIFNDMDAWIKYATDPIDEGGLGFTSVIPVGHSIGATDAALYALNGKYRNKIKGLVFLSPPDQRGIERQRTEGKLEELLEYSRQDIIEGRGNEAVYLDYLALYLSKNTYIDIHGHKSPIFDYSSYENGTNDLLKGLSGIPTLVIAGTHDPFISPEDPDNPEKTMKIFQRYLQAPGSKVELVPANHSLKTYEPKVAEEVVVFTANLK